MEEILGHLLPDNVGALKACSLTCKRMFDAARPYIHQRHVCFYSKLGHVKPKSGLFTHRRRASGAFEQLIYLDRLGVLRYTRRLAFEVKYTSHHPPFDLGDLQECLPHLRSIIQLDSLAHDTFHVPPFTPVPNQHFSMFTSRAIVNADSHEYFAENRPAESRGVGVSSMKMTVSPVGNTLPPDLYVSRSRWNSYVVQVTCMCK